LHIIKELLALKIFELHACNIHGDSVDGRFIAATSNFIALLLAGTQAETKQLP
jgi:hypothetical protein